MLKFKKTAFYAYHKNGVIIILSLFLIMGSLCLHGCGSGKSAVKREEITFNIIPAADVNDSRPVYLVIRKVNRMEFLVESYDSISEMVMATPPNETLLAWQMLLPGRKDVIPVLKPDKTDIGVYVLFSNPGDNWKIMLEGPLKTEYYIKVKSNEIEEYHKGLLW